MSRFRLVIVGGLFLSAALFLSGCAGGSGDVPKIKDPSNAPTLPKLTPGGGGKAAPGPKPV